MSVDHVEENIRAVDERVKEIFARTGGEESPHNQFSAAEVLRTSPRHLRGWTQKRNITVWYLNAVTAQDPIIKNAKEVFLDWMENKKNGHHKVFRDVFYLKAGLLGIEEAREKLKHLVQFNQEGTFEFKTGVSAYQRYKLIRGLRAHQESTDEMYLTHLNNLKEDLKNGPLQNDANKAKILDKINREILLYDQSHHTKDKVLDFYASNLTYSVDYKKLIDLKKAVLGERIIFDYWAGLLNANPILGSVVGVLLFIPYLIGAAITGWNPSSFKTKTQEEINAEFNNIKTERHEKKQCHGSNRYASFYLPAQENQRQAQTIAAGDGSKFSLRARPAAE